MCTRGGGVISREAMRRVPSLGGRQQRKGYSWPLFGVEAQGPKPSGQGGFGRRNFDNNLPLNISATGLASRFFDWWEIGESDVGFWGEEMSSGLQDVFLRFYGKYRDRLTT